MATVQTFSSLLEIAFALNAVFYFYNLKDSSRKIIDKHFEMAEYTLNHEQTLIDLDAKWKDPDEIKDRQGRLNERRSFRGTANYMIAASYSMIDIVMQVITLANSAVILYLLYNAGLEETYEASLLLLNVVFALSIVLPLLYIAVISWLGRKLVYEFLTNDSSTMSFAETLWYTFLQYVGSLISKAREVVHGSVAFTRPIITSARIASVRLGRQLVHPAQARWVQLKRAIERWRGGEP